MSDLGDRLRTFVLEVIEEGRDGDVDGGWLQDRATELGLLVEVEVAGPCDPDGCVCAEVGDFPLVCYRIAPELLR